MNIILIPSISYYHPMFQRPQQLANQFSEHGHNVLYVEPIKFKQNSFLNPHLEVWFADTKKQIFSKTSTLKDHLVKLKFIDERSIIKKLRLNKLYHYFRGKILKPALDNKFEEYINCDRKLVIFQYPLLTEHIPQLKAKGFKIIYDRLDDLSGFKGFTNREKEKELALIKHADLVVTTSNELYNKTVPLSKNVVLIKNAVDLAHFSTAKKASKKYFSRPADLPDGKTIIGYIGAAWDWFDTELLIYLAKKRSDCNFILIGIILDSIKKKLKKYSNIYILGEKKYAVLPSYLHYFDVATIYFKNNDLIKSTNPIKAYEYLAAGKPIVSTYVQELKGFPYTFLSSSKEEFLTNLNETLESKPNILRINNFLKNHTWKARYNDFAYHINNLFGGNAKIK